MPASSARSDVVIVGGGTIGCAAAWLLARRGVDVTVVERGTPGREAAWAAGGMLSPLAEADGPGAFLDLSLSSFERFPGFVEALREASDLDVEYRTSGKLEVALDDSEAERQAARFAWQREQGFETERLDGDEARRLEPSLSPAVRSALRIAPDHRVDNRRFGRALWTAAGHAGASFRLGLPAARVATAAVGDGSGRAVRGVELADGTVIEAAHVIVAAGCWSGELDGLPRPLPVFPVRGQMVAVAAVPPLLERVVAGNGCYLIPRADGRVIIGSTMERVGYRSHPTAGGIATLLRKGLRTVPALADARIAETWAGLRPGTPDDLPVLGPDPDVQGLVYATGHFRNGILLTPVTADIVTAVVTGEASPVDLDAFAPDRSFEEVEVPA